MGQEVTLSPETLRQLQMLELELLKEVDRICKKNHIHYNIVAGTMLGAVRHGGFIPWDDDADVAMLRKDYERFREVCATELDTTRYYFQDHKVTPGYRWGYGKLRVKNTLFLQIGREHMPYEQGVFIDIFPLDAVPDGQLHRTIVNAECFLVRKVLWSKAGIRAEQTAWKRLLCRIINKIPEKTALSWYERLIRQAKKRDTQWTRILMFPTPNRCWGYPVRWYTGVEEISFEGNIFPGVADAKEYLRFKYGDYRILPPPEQRKTHPVSTIKLVEPMFRRTTGNGRSKTV